MPLPLPALLLSLALFLLACGAPATSSTVPTHDRDTTPLTSEPSPTEFPRITALPAAPRMVVGLDLDVLRRTPLYGMLEMSMAGDEPDDVLARRLLEHTHRVTLGAYGDRGDALVLIVRGSVDGVLPTLVDELARAGHAPAPVDRLGFTAYYVGDDIVVVQTEPDCIVLTSPQYLDEILRGAAGRAPVSPLPAPMRSLSDRATLSDAPMTLLFRVDRERGDDPLSTLLEEAGWGGVAGSLEGGELRVVGVAQLPNEARAAQLRSELERAAREEPSEGAASASFAAALRNAIVRGDDAWVEVELRFPPTDIESFMEILRPLAR